MNIFTNYLGKIGSNFQAYAMIPSLALVVTGLFVFEPILKKLELFASTSSISPLVDIGLMATILTLLLGYTLTALNTYIIKVYEGYEVIHKLPFFYPRQVKQAKTLFLKREMLKNRIAVVERRKIKHGGRLDSVLSRLKRRYFLVAADYDNNYPPSIEDVLPTKFGNVLKASESYPMSRYGLDGVAFWPRLIQVIPSHYQESIEASRNELSFLVNMSVLSFALFGVCAVAVIIGPAFTAASLDDFVFTFLRFGITAFLALALGVLFYKASLYSVSDFGYMIRSAYDLFRFDLLKQLHLKAPSHSVEEYKTWQNLNEFVILGAESIEFVPLVYEQQDNKEGKEEKKAQL